MSEITIAGLASQIDALPLPEQQKIFATLRAKFETGTLAPPHGVSKVAPIPVPDPAPSRRWMKENAHAYGGQWVALDGDRLIAHGAEASEVFAAADADGAYLPLLTYLEPADALPFAGV